MASAAGPATPPGHVPPERVVDFDIYDLHRHANDFFEAWLTLQRPGGPELVWSPRNGGHWIVTGGALIASLFPRGDLLSNRVVAVPPEIGTLTRFIPLQSDAPEHAAFRAPIVKALDSKRVLAMEPMIRAAARALVAEASAAREYEFVSQFAEVLPIHAFLTLIGLPPEDRPALRKLGEQLNRPDGTMTPEELVGAATRYLQPYVEARMAAPGDDLLSRVLAQPVDGRPWSPDEAMRMCRNLLFGGLDTVAAMFGFTMQHLAAHPQDRAALRDAPRLIPRAAAEFTRRFGSVTNARVAAVDFEADGQAVKAGDVVLLPTMLHNLDDRCFPDARRVDFRRGIVRHSTMGHGPHRCLGASLAQLELTILLEEWSRAIPAFALDPERPAAMRGGGVGSLQSLPLLIAA
jgi:cytochrome P450